MGGIGSGSHNASHTIVEDSRVLRLSVLRRSGMFGFNKACRANYSWKRGDKMAGSIVVHVRCEGFGGYLELRYRAQSTSEEWTSICECFPLVTTSPHFGGKRYWVLCSCGRRTANLYVAPHSRYFRCRRCTHAVYQSQREKKVDRMLRRARKVRARLGPRGARPRGMHFGTYVRLTTLADELEEAGLAAGLLRILSRGR